MLVFMCVIYAASAVPGDRMPVVIHDKVAHTLQYFVLGILIALFFAGFQSASTRRRQRSSAMLGAVYAATDEIHQSWVPNRVPSVADFVFDLLGLLLAGLVIWLGVRSVK